MKTRISFLLAMAALMLLPSPTLAAEVTDDYGVITSPAEGVHKVYKRSGKAYNYSSDNALNQSGRVEIVECADGTVYVKDIVSLFSNNTWVKGTKSGATITIPTKQTVYAEEDSWGWDTYIYELAWGSSTYDDWWEVYTKTIDNTKAEINFTVNGDVITLNGSDENSYIGVFRRTEYSSSYTFRYGDYSTVWTLDADYQPATTDLVEIPAGLETDTWFATGVSAGTPFKKTVTVGFADGFVYVKNLFTDFPDAWVKGTVGSTTVTFKAMQYLGKKSGKDCWLTGTDMADVAMTYDAGNSKLTAEGSVIATNSEEKVSAVATYTDVVLSGEEEKINELPYSNALSTANDFLQFTVIDANADGKTWNYTTNGVRYSYSGSNNGDDWLISPAIKLEAGKLYHFAIDAKNEGYQEKMEVKLATAATAEALESGISLLEPTAITSSSYSTFESETASVDASGFYYFGIHAISDADQYYLTVKNFLVEEGAASSAPAAVGELSVEQAEGELAVNISFTAPTNNMNGDNLSENLTKIEIKRDEALVKVFTDIAPGETLSYKDDADELTYGSHTYQVVPYNADGAGQKSEATVYLMGTPVTVPADLETATWNVMYNTNVKTTATVGFAANEVYVQGLFSDFPNAWIKGSISGTAVTFASGQFLGVKNNSNIWMTSSDSDDETFEDFVMTYNADGKILTAQNELLANYGLDEIYVLARLRNVVIQEEEFSEPAAETAADVDELPYANALNTQTLFADFGVLDVNGDGSTWKWSTQNNAPYYNYGFDDDADDWLVSPAIRLEAGKTYHFAIDAKRGSSSQSFEVKMATKATATKLAAGQPVIAQTSLTTTYATYEKTELAVSETGYYHFGIHAYTDAWSNIYVQNFLVEAGVEVTAPAAVNDLAVVQAGEQLAANVSFTAPTKDLSGNDLTENLTSVEIMRDETVVKTFEDVIPGAAMTYIDDNGLTIGKHKYQVVANNQSGAGQKSDEVEVFINGTLTVPYVADFTDQGTFALFTVIDNNEDNTTWTWASATSGARYACDDYEDGDDYLVTMPIKLQAGKNYKVTVTARNYYDDWDNQSFEVLVGKTATAAGLTQTAIAQTAVESSDFEDFTGTFSVEESGNYYMAIHATSEAYNYYLYVKTLTIEEEAPTSIIVEIAHAGYATFSSTVAFDLSGVAGIQAYTAAVDADGNIVFNEIEKIPANTGVLLVNTTAEEPLSAIDVPVIADDQAGEVADNALVAVGTAIESLPTEDANGKNFILNNGSKGIGFYRAAGQMVDAGKAYLRMPVTESRMFIGIGSDGSATAISKTTEHESQDTKYYDLQGRRIAGDQHLKKGLYIHNGKKNSY